MVTVKIGEKELPMVFDMKTFEQVEEEVGMMPELNDLLNGRSRIRNLIKIIRIYANRGLEKSGSEERITDEWLEDNMKPAMMPIYQVAVFEIFGQGMQMETEEEKKNGKRDFVLEEIEKKKETEE